MRLGHGQYFGEPLRRGTAGALTLIETSYARGLTAGRHTHECSCLCIVVDGGFAETYGRAERTCRAGSIIFRPAGEDHANHFAIGARCLNIELSDAWMERLAEYAPVTASSIDLTHTPVRDVAMRMYGEFQIGDDLAPLALDGLAVETLARLSRRLRAMPHGPPAWLARVREILHELPAPSTLAELAASAEVHPVHLARSFRQHYGCSIGAYVRRIRIDKACRLLDTTTLTLSQIALEVGFSHHSHFANAFKRATGQTPAAYRRRR
jgi:AraC family transcriptional regulator